MTEIICIFSILLSAAVETPAASPPDPPAAERTEPNALPPLLLSPASASLDASRGSRQEIAGDINSLAGEAKLTYEGFVRDNFPLRLEYEFAGKFFSDEHRSKMQQLARQASDKLTEIENKQRKFKQQIEDYEGDDWEARFGSTSPATSGSSGLWRKLTTDIYITTASNCQIGFYLAVSSDERQKKDDILKRVLNKIEVLEQTGGGRDLKFLKAKVLGTLSTDELLYRPPARKEFESAAGWGKNGEKDCSDFQTAIEKIKLLGEDEPGQLESLTKRFFAGDCRNDLELVLSLISLQYRLERKEAFEKTVLANPQTQDITGSLLLGCLGSRAGDEKVFEDAGVFEAELAAQRAMKEGAEKHKGLLLKLAAEKKFQTPLVFYAAALACATYEPNKAVDFFIESSKLQNQKKSERLDVDAKTLAAQTAKFALDCFGKKTVDCQSVVRACENYRSIAAGQSEPQIDYLYAAVLNDCNQSENGFDKLTTKGEKLLRDLADRNTGFWSERAKLDLIEKTIKSEKLKQKAVSDSTISELNDFITNCSGQDSWSKQLRCEATALYCQLLLESENDASLEKVVNIVDSNIAGYEPNIGAYKAAALQRLGRLDESARWLLIAFRPGHCEHTQQATALLSEVIEKIDYLKESAAGGKDFTKAAGDFEQLARNCCNCPDSNNRQAKLFWAETAVFAAENQTSKSEKIEKLLNSIEPNDEPADIDLLRCRARVLAELGKFEQAARVWAQICKMEESRVTAAGQRGEHWWRAKYYELHCWSQMEQTNKNDVVHTIEVLEKTYDQRPAFWAGKLKLLKQQCSGTGKF
jgi:hypothetical protein